MIDLRSALLAAHAYIADGGLAETEPGRSIYQQITAALAAPAGEPLTFAYRNWRGEVGTRHVRPISVRYGSTEWHPEPQWLLLAHDLDKDAEREFAMRDIGAAPAGEPVAWRVRVASPDPEEWVLLPAGGGADYVGRRGYEVQPLYPAPPDAAVIRAQALEEAAIWHEMRAAEIDAVHKTMTAGQRLLDVGGRAVALMHDRSAASIRALKDKEPGR